MHLPHNLVISADFVKFLPNTFRSVNHLPQLAPRCFRLNTALGALFGALQAVLVLFIAALCLTAVACAAPESAFATAISDSKICSLAVEILHMI